MTTAGLACGSVWTVRPSSGGSVPVPAPTDGATGPAEQGEDGADDGEDDADRRQDADLQEKTQHQEHDSEDDQVVLHMVGSTGIRRPVCEVCYPRSPRSIATITDLTRSG